MSWGSTPLRHAAQVSVSNVDKKSVEGQRPVRLVNYTDVYYGDTISPSDELMSATATPDQVSRFGVRAGDTLITKDSETPDDIAVPAFIGSAAPDMVCGYHLAMVRPSARYHPRFLYWALTSQQVREQAAVAAKGMTRYGITVGAIQSLQVPLPPLEVQRRIADFLDDQTTRIDNIITARKQQMELIENMRRAETQKHFDDVLADGAPTISLRWLCPYFLDGDWIEAPYIADEGIRLIQTGNVGVGAFRDQGFKFISLETFIALGCKDVYPGDVLISRLSIPVARACLAPNLGCRMITSVDVVIARPDQDAILPEYLVFALSTPRHLSDADNLARGATMQRLSRSQVGALKVPTPPVGTQRAVMYSIRNAWEYADSGSSTLQASVFALQELKRSLISAAVSGEFDVSSADGSRVVA